MDVSLLSLDLLDICLATGIILIGAAMQGAVGFGMGPFSVPLLVLIDPVFVPGPLILAAIILTALMYFREKHAVIARDIRWAVSGRFVGAIIGANLLRWIPKNELSLFFGIMVLIAVAILAGGMHVPLTRRNLLGAGTLSGLMATASAIGGPPMALIYKEQAGPRIRGSMAIIFMIGAIFGIGSLIWVGRFSMQELMTSIVLWPGILIGYWLSGFVKHHLDRKKLRTAIYTISTAASAVLILRYFLS